MLPYEYQNVYFKHIPAAYQRDSLVDTAILYDSSPRLWKNTKYIYINKVYFQRPSPSPPVTADASRKYIHIGLIRDPTPFCFTRFVLRVGRGAGGGRRDIVESRPQIAAMLQVVPEPGAGTAAKKLCVCLRMIGQASHM